MSESPSLKIMEREASVLSLATPELTRDRSAFSSAEEDIGNLSTPKWGSLQKRRHGDSFSIHKLSPFSQERRISSFEHTFTSLPIDTDDSLLSKAESSILVHETDEPSVQESVILNPLFPNNDDSSRSSFQALREYKQHLLNEEAAGKWSYERFEMSRSEEPEISAITYEESFMVDSTQATVAAEQNDEINQHDEINRLFSQDLLKNYELEPNNKRETAFFQGGSCCNDYPALTQLLALYTACTASSQDVSAKKKQQQQQQQKQQSLWESFLDGEDLVDDFSALDPTFVSTSSEEEVEESSCGESFDDRIALDRHALARHRWQDMDEQERFHC